MNRRGRDWNGEEYRVLEIARERATQPEARYEDGNEGPPRNFEGVISLLERFMEPRANPP